MNIKPTPEQVDNWELKAAQCADSQTGEYYEYQQAKNEKFAELAAQWGAAQAQQTTIEEPELPEPVVAREEYAVGTGEFYTATQMREHYAAGVRAGAAGSQDGLSQVISGAIFDFAGYLTTRTNVIEVGSTANASPVADLVKEWAALRGLSLDDAAVLSWQEWLNAAMQGGQQ